MLFGSNSSPAQSFKLSIALNERQLILDWMGKHWQISTSSPKERTSTQKLRVRLHCWFATEGKNNTYFHSQKGVLFISFTSQVSTNDLHSWSHLLARVKHPGWEHGEILQHLISTKLTCTSWSQQASFPPFDRLCLQKAYTLNISKALKSWVTFGLEKTVRSH